MLPISVIMSVYNSEQYISETIESVLSQSFKHFEFIIINDGSNDNSENIILQYNDPRIVYLYKENEGLSKALNLGLKLAKGKYIARIDSDDICQKDRFLKQYSFLESNPTYAICGSTADVIDEHGDYIYTFENIPKLNVDIQIEMERQNCIVHSTAFFLRETALKIGGYYEPIKQYFEDYMLFYQFIKIGKAFNFTEPLIKYRLTPGSITTRVKNRKYEKLVKDVVKRGYIKDVEKTFLFNFKKQKSKKDIQFSNHYLTLSRLILSHQHDYSKSKQYFKKGLTESPLNFNIILSAIFIIHSYLKIQIFKLIPPTKN